MKVMRIFSHNGCNVTNHLTMNYIGRVLVNTVFLGFVLGLGSHAYAQSELEGSYVLDSGDKIFIQVFDEQDLTMEALVSSNGVINYSFLGTLEVSGRTTEQIEQTITELLKDGYLVNPSVNVTVTGYRLYYISGEVNKPGGYPYVPGLNLEQALATAGGLTDRASKRKMYLIKGSSSDKGRKRVKLTAAIDPGDTITIEEGFF